jgi:hypothetical protein
LSDIEDKPERSWRIGKGTVFLTSVGLLAHLCGVMAVLPSGLQGEFGPLFGYASFSFFIGIAALGLSSAKPETSYRTDRTAYVALQFFFLSGLFALIGLAICVFFFCVCVVVFR